MRKSTEEFFVELANDCCKDGTPCNVCPVFQECTDWWDNIFSEGPCVTEEHRPQLLIQFSAMKGKKRRQLIGSKL